MSARLTLALERGGLELPGTGALRVSAPTADTDLSALPRARVRVVQPFRPDYDHFRRMGFDCEPQADHPCAAAIVCLPRAKALARALIHDACRLSAGPVVVDGAKPDGIDSLLREIRARVEVQGFLAKAHGKIFWFAPDARAFADWQAPADQRVGGFVTAPGVFSADGIDPASALLVSALPDVPGRQIVDLGAGWGYLSAHLAREPRIERLDLVEADATALACARRNITDPRARFHWADARGWAAEGRADAVVMNPPFHDGRAADPGLGRSFIEAAARILAPSGGLWMVANRHLPYEAALRSRFAQVREMAGDARFKVFEARHPSRTGR